MTKNFTLPTEIETAQQLAASPEELMCALVETLGQDDSANRSYGDPRKQFARELARLQRTERSRDRRHGGESSPDEDFPTFQVSGARPPETD